MCGTISIALFAVFAIIASASSGRVSPAKQCPGFSFDGLRERIRVDPCDSSECRLQKGKTTTVHFKFNPEHEVITLTNEVYAIVGILKLPFFGVTGTDACPQVTRADDGQPARCPLAPNQEYLYSNAFPIENYYPKMKLSVHWRLIDGDDTIICFEIPARIV